ncbi:MAG: DUF3278 domain-containing protein [Lautropia sp.]|nr:DUF3278 domain-containing protein [Lautropia sp.]
MPKNDSLEQRLKRRLIGGRGPLDEGKEREINQVLAGLATWSFYLTTGLMLISLLVDVHGWDARHHRVSFGTLALLALQQFSAYYLFIRMRKSDVLDCRVASDTDYRRELLLLRRSSAWSGLGWGVWMMAMMNWLLPMIADEPVKTGFVHYVIWLAGGVVFGWIMYVWQKRHIIVETADPSDDGR